jgi:hypothetical protein
MPKVNVSVAIGAADNLTKCAWKHWNFPNYGRCILVWCTLLPVAVIVVLACGFLFWEWLFSLRAQAHAARPNHIQHAKLCTHV